MTSVARNPRQKTLAETKAPPAPRFPGSEPIHEAVAAADGVMRHSGILCSQDGCEEPAVTPRNVSGYRWCAGHDPAGGMR